MLLEMVHRSHETLPTQIQGLCTMIISCWQPGSNQPRNGETQALVLQAAQGCVLFWWTLDKIRRLHHSTHSDVLGCNSAACKAGPIN